MSTPAEALPAPTAPTAGRGPTRHRGFVAASWITATILLLAAWLVVGATPSAPEWQGPFEVKVPIGEWGTGRNITARVVDIKFTDQLDEWSVSHPGNWLVVDIEAAAVTEQDYLSAWLTLDGATYQSSERTTATMYKKSLTPGIPFAGSLFFELPPGIESGDAVVQIGMGLNQYPTLDSLIVIPIELDSAVRLPSVQPSSPTWAAP